MKEIIDIPEAPKVEPAGTITIEITDAETGELVTQERKDNFVQTRQLQAMTEYAAFAMMGLKTTYLNPAEMLNGLELTDNAAAPDPANENFPFGRPVGYGVRDQAAYSSNRGAWNAVESVIQSNYIKFVFDFATSQGNGTFQSIYTRYFPNANDPAYVYSPTLQGQVDFPFNWNRFVKAGNAIYFMYSATPTVLYKVSLFDLKFDFNPSNPMFKGEYETITFPAAYNYSNSLIRGNEIFKIESNVVYKASINPVSNWTAVKTLGFSAYNMAYHEGTDRFYVEKNASADYVLYVYDSAWNLIEVLEAGKYTSGLNYITDDGKFMRKSSGQLIPLAGGREVYLANSTNGNYAMQSGFEIGKYMLWYSNYSRCRITTAPQFFSRVLLDAPVTKTSQQNMKITYEFIIPQLKLWGV